MSVVIFVFILLGFMQTTLLPYQLVLLFLVTRSFVTEDTQNYYLAFGSGLFVAFLSGQLLGILSIMYIVVVKLVYLIRYMPFTSKWYFIFPVSLLMVGLIEMGESIIFQKAIDTKSLGMHIMFVLPLYIFARFWEDRFIPKKEVRLKVGK